MFTAVNSQKDKGLKVHGVFREGQGTARRPKLTGNEAGKMGV